MKDNLQLEQIRGILKEKFFIKKKITLETNLSDLKNWDSLSQLDFIMILEKNLKLNFN